MIKQILRMLEGFTSLEKQHFYVSVVSNLTIELRDSLATGEQNLNTSVLLNEIMHRVLNQVITF